MNAGAVKANCCTSPLFSFRSLKTFIFSPSFSTSPSALNMEELICSFCKQHLILFIFLLVFPPSLSQAGLCCQALPEQRGCQEWWMTINLLLSSTTLLGDLQARWLPGMKTNLSFSFFPPFLHPCLPRSFRLTPSVSTSRPLQKTKKKSFVMERCALNNIEICVRTQASDCFSWGLLWMCQRGIACSEWYARSLTAYLAHLHLHLPHCFQLLHKLTAHTSIHILLAVSNYSIGERCQANCCLKIVIALLSQPFLVMIVQRHYVNAIKWFHYYSC